VVDPSLVDQAEGAVVHPPQIDADDIGAEPCTA